MAKSGKDELYSHRVLCSVQSDSLNFGSILAKKNMLENPLELYTLLVDVCESLTVYHQKSVYHYRILRSQH